MFYFIYHLYFLPPPPPFGRVHVILFIVTAQCLNVTVHGPQTLSGTLLSDVKEAMAVSSVCKAQLSSPLIHILQMRHCISSELSSFCLSYCCSSYWGENGLYYVRNTRQMIRLNQLTVIDTENGFTDKLVLTLEWKNKI